LAVLLAWCEAVSAKSKSSNRRIDPFVNGGVSVLFAGQSVSLRAAHFGGGFNYSLQRRFGVRFEFRHHL
jgi:hypothetical protein